MRAAGQMASRVTPLTLAVTKDARGAHSESWTTGTAVWGTLTLADERSRSFLGGLTDPMTHVLTVDSVAWAVAGNRVTIAGVTYDIIGSDHGSPMTHLGLHEVAQ